MRLFLVILLIALALVNMAAAGKHAEDAEADGESVKHMKKYLKGEADGESVKHMKKHWKGEADGESVKHMKKHWKGEADGESVKKHKKAKGEADGEAAEVARLTKMKDGVMKMAKSLAEKAAKGEADGESVKHMKKHWKGEADGESVKHMKKYWKGEADGESVKVSFEMREGCRIQCRIGWADGWTQRLPVFFFSHAPTPTTQKTTTTGLEARQEARRGLKGVRPPFSSLSLPLKL
jgi:hypothetical protein